MNFSCRIVKPDISHSNHIDGVLLLGTNGLVLGFDFPQYIFSCCISRARQRSLKKLENSYDEYLKLPIFQCMLILQ
jgi:hypothetical protein